MAMTCSGLLEGSTGPPDAPPDREADELTQAASLLQRFVAKDGAAAADADGLTSVVSTMRDVERLMALLGVQIAQRAEQLAANGEGAGPIETLLATGEHVTGRRARTEAARAELIARWPALADALHTGRVRPAAVDALARQLRRLNDEQRALLPLDTLLSEAMNLPVDTFTRVVGRAVARAEMRRGDGSGHVDPSRRARFEHWFDDATGMGRCAAWLDPESYEAVTAAVEQHMAALANADTSVTNRGPVVAARALCELITGSGARSAHLPLPTVVVGPDGSSDTGDGHPLSIDALQRLSCDAVVQRVRLDERGVPIDVGRRRRTATGTQWTAIRAVYRTCGWVGCDQALSRCQLHHIREWAKGGRTDLENLVPLCSHHHHLVHDAGWRLRLTSDRRPVITSPTGRRITGPAPGRRSPPR